MATKVGMGIKKKEAKKDNLKAKIAELEKENVKIIKEVETLTKENEELKTKIAELEKAK